MRTGSEKLESSRVTPRSGQLARDYFWNTAASLLTSLSTVVMLGVVTRTAGVAAGGIYSLALAVGQQFQTLGMFEVRSYHITDVRHVFPFGTYLTTRFVTVTAMLIGIIGYAVWSGGGAETIALVALVASLRLFDAFEDVFYSELQRAGRLDLGGMASCVRVTATTVSFSVMLILTHDLRTSAITTIVVSALALIGSYVPASRGLFPLRPLWTLRPVGRVLYECLPLFLGSFLSMYLANAPRYAIDRYMDASAQGIFAIIYMPAVAINLLSLFIYRPLVTRMAAQWTAGDHRGFMAAVRRGLAGTLVAFAAVAIVSFVAGPPILQIVFGADVSPFRTELMVLVAAGALNAVSVVLFYALTTMRRQQLVFVGFVLAAAATVILCRVLVPVHGLLGASLAYLASMAVLSAAFALFLGRPTARSAVGR